MNRQTLCLLIAVIMLVGGCSSGTGQPDRTDGPAPAAPQAVPQPESAPAAQPLPATVIPGPVPRITEAEIRMGEDYPDGGGGFMLGERALEPGDSFAPTDDFVLFLSLSPGPDHAWFEAVKVEGSDAELPRAQNSDQWLQLLVPDGTPGTTLTVTLPPVEGAAGPTVYRLTRVAPPTARLEIEQGGAWQPVDPERFYPNRNLRLRFTFTAPMNRPTVEESLRKSRLPLKDPAREKLRFTWTDDKTLIAELDEAPAVLIPGLVGSQDQRGLYLTGRAPNVYTGPAPYLAAVNPASGAERRLREMMAEVTGVQSARSGDTLLVTVYGQQAGQNNGYPRYRPWLLNLKAGTIRPIDGEPWGLTLLPTGEVWSHKYPEELVKGYKLGPFSPDGSQRIFVRLSDGEKNRGDYDEAGLELRTADGKLLKELPVRPRVRVQKFGYRQVDIAWSPDGTSIIFTNEVDDKSTELVTIDLTSGVTQKIATVPAYSNMLRIGKPLQWAGRRVLADKTVVDLDSGQTRTVGGSIIICWLSPDGRYLLVARDYYHPGHWGTVSIVDVDSGATVEAGEGLAVGWAGDGEALIYRWQNYPYRYYHQGP